jgi:hypothetical protein
MPWLRFHKPFTLMLTAKCMRSYKIGAIALVSQREARAAIAQGKATECDPDGEPLTQSRLRNDEVRS